ncbi:TPA: ATP-binding cassette domain-containing protein [Streptococcus agalactiae]
MKLHKGELIGLIGPNGAGKTTLFNLLTGVYLPSKGTISLDGKILNGRKPAKIASLGLGRTFQNIRLFKNMTVLDNVLVGLSNHHLSHPIASFLRLPKYYHSEKALRKKALELLEIFGLVRPSQGSISFMGKPIHKLAARKIVGNGLAQVPEGRHVFSSLSVMENLEMGAFLQKDREQNQKMLKKVFDRFPRLEERKNQDAATLSGGEQQMLAMGRALMSRPKLLLLDEPSMGLAPIFIQEIFNIIEDIKKQGTTVLLVEQNANKALTIADKAYVLETGKVVLSGTGKELLVSDQVRKAYLGG